MKKILKFFIFYLFFLSLFINSTLACQPCPYKLNFTETVDKSDLIIVGRKVGGSFNYIENEKIEYVDLEVSEILKGKNDKKTIKARTRYGMCDYGIIIPDYQFSYVVFLKKDSNQDYYTSVNSGCAIKTFLIIDDQVYFKERADDKNIQLISIDELVKKIGPEGKREKIKKQEEINSSNLKGSKYNFSIFLLLPLLILIFIFLFFFIAILIIILLAVLIFLIIFFSIRIIKDKDYSKKKPLLMSCVGLIILIIVILVFYFTKFR